MENHPRLINKSIIAEGLERVNAGKSLSESGCM